MVTTSLGDVIETKHISFRILPTFCNFVIYGARKPNPNLNQNYRTRGSNIINMVELKFTTIFPPPPQKNTDFLLLPIDKNAFIKVQEHSREVLVHHWSKNKSKIGLTDVGKRIISVYLCYPSFEATQLSAIRHRLGR